MRNEVSVILADLFLLHGMLALVQHLTWISQAILGFLEP